MGLSSIRRYLYKKGRLRQNLEDTHIHIQAKGQYIPHRRDKDFVDIHWYWCIKIRLQQNHPTKKIKIEHEGGFKLFFV